MSNDDKRLAQRQFNESVEFESKVRFYDELISDLHNAVKNLDQKVMYLKDTHIPELEKELGKKSLSDDQKHQIQMQLFNANDNLFRSKIDLRDLMVRENSAQIYKAKYEKRVEAQKQYVEKTLKEMNKNKKGVLKEAKAILSKINATHPMFPRKSRLKEVYQKLKADNFDADFDRVENYKALCAEVSIIKSQTKQLQPAK